LNTRRDYLSRYTLSLNLFTYYLFKKLPIVTLINIASQTSFRVQTLSSHLSDPLHRRFDRPSFSCQVSYQDTDVQKLKTEVQKLKTENAFFRTVRTCIMYIFALSAMPCQLLIPLFLLIVLDISANSFQRSPTVRQRITSTFVLPNPHSDGASKEYLALAISQYTGGEEQFHVPLVCRSIER